MKRSRQVAILPFGLMLAGCDPFAPAQPEAPSNTRVAVVASLPEDVSAEWGKALASRDILHVGDVAAEALQLLQSGDSMSNASFVNCLQGKLFASVGNLSAPVWSAVMQDPIAAGTDSVVAKIDYSIAVGSSGAKISGTAKWTLSNLNTPGWELVRWEDLAESRSGLFAYCREGTK